jgi:hypothetical protein
MIKKILTLLIGLICVGFLSTLIFTHRAQAENCNASVNFDINPKIVASVNDPITLTATLTIANPQACKSGFNSIGADFQFYWTSGHSTLISSGWTVLNLSGSSTFTKSGSITTRLADLGFTTTQSSISFYARIQGYGLKAGETQKTDAIIFDPSRYKFDVTSSTVNLGVNQTPAPVRRYSCVNNKCQLDENGGYSGIESCLSVCEGGAFTPPPSSITQTYVFNLPNPIGVTTFQDFVNIIGKWIFNLAIPIAVIIIIWAGVLMLTSGGDPGRFKKGAAALKYAVIGLAIVLIGKGFVTLIQSILNLRNR